MKTIFYLFTAASVWAACLADAQSSANAQTVPSAFTSGGGTGTGGDYTTTHTLGETFAGSSSGGNYTVAAGFLAMDADAPAVQATPRLVLRVSNRTATITFQTQSQVSYVVEYTDSLWPPNWRLLSHVAGTGASTVVTDDARSPMRFYRLNVSSQP